MSGELSRESDPVTRIPVYPEASARVGKLVVYQPHANGAWVVADARTGEVLDEYARYADAIRRAMRDG